MLVLNFFALLISIAPSAKAQANLTISKTVDKLIAYPGETLIYTIAFNNTASPLPGNESSHVWINDTLPNHVTYVSNTSESVGLINMSWRTGNTLHFLFMNVPGGGIEYSFDIVVTVNLTTPPWSFLNNKVNMTYTNAIGIWQGQDFANASATVFAPRIKPVKTVDRSQAYPGDHLNYTLYFNNTGNDVAYNVTIDDVLPQNVTYLSDSGASVPCTSNTANLPLMQFNCSWVAPGSSSITIEVMVNIGLGDGITVDNLMIVDYQTLTGVPLQTEIASAQTVVRTSSFTFAKMVDKQIVGPDDFINYTIYFNNTGSAAGAFAWLNDTLPDDVLYLGSSIPPYSANGQDYSWNLTEANLYPGPHMLIIYALVMTQSGNWLNNTATFEYTDPNGNYVGNRTSRADVQFYAMPSFTLEKTSDKSEVSRNEVFNYTIHFNNTGNGNALYVWINDSLPSNVTYMSDTSASIPGGMKIGDYNWSFTNLAPGGYSFDITVIVDSNARNGTVLWNEVDLEYTDAGGLPIEKLKANATVQVVSIPLIDTAITVDKQMATKNEVLNYTIYYNNTGNGYASNLELNVSLSPGLTFLDSKIPPDPGSLPELKWTVIDLFPGTNSFWMTAKVNSDVLNGQVLKASLYSNYTDEDQKVQRGQPAYASTTVGFPEMTVEKEANMPEFHPGDELIYIITFKNTGLVPASYVWVNDTFLANLIYINNTADSLPYYQGCTLVPNKFMCVFADVPSGAHSFNVTYRVGDNLADGAPVNSLIDLEYVDYLYNHWSTNYGHFAFSYRPVIIGNLEAYKATASIGDLVDLVISFDNNGGANATQLWVNLSAPGFTYMDDDSNSVTGTGGGSMQEPWKWLFTDVSPGAHLFTVSAMMNGGVVDGEILTVSFGCEYAYNDVWFAIDGNRTGDVVVKGSPYFELQVSLDRPDPSPGTEIMYTVSFENIGNAPAMFVWINMSIPHGMTYVSDTHSAAQGIGSAEMTEVGSWLFENVGIGPHDYVVVLRSDKDLPDGAKLIPVFELEYADYYGARYGPVFASAETDLSRPVFGLSVAVTETSPEPGQIIIFTVTINNTGNASSGLVTVKLVSEDLNYVDDDADALNGTRPGDLTFAFPGLGKGEHSFDLVAKVDGETTKSFLNATFEVEYADTTNSTAWETNRTVRLTLEIDIPIIVPQVPVNMLPILLVVVALIGMGSMLLSENTKYGLFFFFLPLYTKLRKKNILEHETRGMIRGYVIANPGDHFNSIKKALSLNNGTLAYHLHVLEREGLIKSKRWGKFTRFYPSGMKLPENGSRYSEIQKIIMTKIGETPGISQKEIAAVMGVTKSTINYHINRLTELGVVDARRAGIKIRYFLVEEVEPLDS
jgi:uncharacterized repeat protein (TIGR01451 family)